MSIKLQLPKLTDLKPRITVVGVGGAGGNAINNMIAAGLAGVDFIVANTDAQALATSSAERRIQLGVNLTEGLGAGSKPEIGEAAAEEAIDEIRSQVAGSHMVFIAAGMGGGTGTGAAAVIARAARELGILTVGVVTKPFQFEGARRMRSAEAGIAELKKYVDTLIVIPNQNLFRIASDRTTFAEAFVLADQVLYAGIACIVDLIVKEGLINLDFADVRTVMSGMGSAMMGTGEAAGERRAIVAAEEAIANPLLDEVSLKGARGLLLSIIGGRDMTLYEVDEAASRVRQEVDPEANIIVGATFDDSMGDRIRVAIVASGMQATAATAATSPAPTAPNSLQRGQPRPAGAQTIGIEPPTLRHLAGHSAAIAVGGTPGDAGSGRHAPPALPPPPLVSYGNLAAAGIPPVGTAPGASPSSGSPGRTSASMPPPLPQHPRELWRAPGDVVIEEAPPPVQPAPRRATASPSEPARPPETFSPAAPVDVRGGVPRRMPEVNDFPTVGQREYRAKAAQYEERAPQSQATDQPQPGPRVYADRPAAQPARRGGLFQRLVGGQVAARPPVQTTPPPAGPAPQTREQKPAASGLELPFFYSRNKG